MSRRWMGTALIALWFAHTASAQAPYLPIQNGPAPLPEPLPCQSAAPAAAAPMPSGCVSAVELPSNTPNAWCDEAPCCPPACYFFFGGMGLARQRTGHVPIAVLD